MDKLDKKLINMNQKDDFDLVTAGLKTCAIMCAYNEAPKKGYKSYLGNSINILKKSIKKGVLNKAIIVDDGSTDDTSHYIKKKIKKFQG